MGSMVMSTFMMFVPQRVEFLFFVLLCIGFFGVYVPWNERKKKGTTRKKRPSQPRRIQRSSASARLEQLETLKGAGLMDEREYQEKRKDILRDL